MIYGNSILQILNIEKCKDKEIFPQKEMDIVCNIIMENYMYLEGYMILLGNWTIFISTT
jgi:hypothetical protein